MERSFPAVFTCIRCMTYNQSVYITDAMNGFCMQQTNFPFLAIVMDDASTDGEQVVIEDYIKGNFLLSDNSCLKWETEEANWLFAQHCENSNCYFLVVFLKRNMYKQKQAKLELIKEWEDKCKYIALCEGDDYWTDSLKLQKQVDFLERHEDFSMCFHAAKILSQGVDISRTGAMCERIMDKEYTSTEMFENWIVPTASMMYRKDMFDRFKMKHEEWLTRGDIALVLRCSHTGKVWGMCDTMSVYRLQPNSVSHNQEYRDSEVYSLPNHFRCIYLNFPKVDRKPIVWNISHAYYARMKKQSNIVLIVNDFCLFVYWCPQYAISKIKEIIIRGKNKK